MFLSDLFHNASKEREFRKNVESSLRAGEADKALHGVSGALEAYAAQGFPLAQIALDTTVEQIEVVGWSDVRAKIAGLEQRAAIGKKTKPITAVGIDFSWPGHINLHPDENGCLDPFIETTFYSDAAYPFSTSSRAELIAGYGSYGSDWQGNFEDIGDAISIKGMGRLYGAGYLARDGSSAGIEGLGSAGEQDAARLAALYAAVLLHIAVRETIARKGLIRPLAVIVGSNEDYPFLNAPVLSADEAAAFVKVSAYSGQGKERSDPDGAYSAEADERRARSTQRKSRAANDANFERACDQLADAAAIAARTVGEMVGKGEGRKALATAVIAGFAIWGHLRRNR